MKSSHVLFTLTAAVLVFSTLASLRARATRRGASVMTEPTSEARLATLGAGCFWCVEAVFAELEGVRQVTSGYSGGHVPNPTYAAVCEGLTGHAEVIQVRFDPARVAFEELLEVFWKTHDPTTPDRQGADVGSQYRSVIFFHDEAQREAAEHFKGRLDASGAFAAPIVTQIVPFERFWPAEDCHQNYYAANPEQGYCRAVIRPKLEKFREAFGEKLAR